MFEVDDSLAGRSADCAQCHRPLSVPSAHLAADDAARPRRPGQSYADDPNIDISKRDAPRYPSYEEGNKALKGWMIFIAIIIAINIFLIPFTGWAIVPR